MMGRGSRVREMTYCGEDIHGQVVTVDVTVGEGVTFNGVIATCPCGLEAWHRMTMALLFPALPAVAVAVHEAVAANA